jgi:tRNA threonylcarbamoyladenosine biosynthesis protein TsaE
MVTRSVEETIAAGKRFARENLCKTAGTDTDSVVVLLQGEMGAGKTHFVKGIAQGLDIDSVITSPTFAIVNDYGGLIHMDLFRIRSEDDLYAIGYYDYSGIIVVEWAENVPELQGDFTVRIEKLNEDGENTRQITGA